MCEMSGLSVNVQAWDWDCGNEYVFIETFVSCISVEYSVVNFGIWSKNETFRGFHNSGRIPSFVLIIPLRGLRSECFTIEFLNERAFHESNNESGQFWRSDDVAMLVLFVEVFEADWVRTNGTLPNSSLVQLEDKIM